MTILLFAVTGCSPSDEPSLGAFDQGRTPQDADTISSNAADALRRAATATLQLPLLASDGNLQIGDKRYEHIRESLITEAADRPQATRVALGGFSFVHFEEVKAVSPPVAPDELSEWEPVQLDQWPGRVEQLRTAQGWAASPLMVALLEGGLTTPILEALRDPTDVSLMEPTGDGDEVITRYRATIAAANIAAAPMQAEVTVAEDTALVQTIQVVLTPSDGPTSELTLDVNRGDQAFMSMIFPDPFELQSLLADKPDPTTPASSPTTEPTTTLAAGQVDGYLDGAIATYMQSPELKLPGPSVSLPTDEGELATLVLYAYHEPNEIIEFMSEQNAPEYTTAAPDDPMGRWGPRTDATVRLLGPFEVVYDVYVYTPDSVSVQHANEEYGAGGNWVDIIVRS